MAVAFKSISSQSWEDDDSGTTIQVDFPTNVEGDFLLAVMGLSNVGASSNISVDAETGWTKLTENYWTSATSGTTAIYYRFAPPGGLTGQEFDAASTTGYVAYGLVYTGVDTTTPIDVGPNMNQNVASTFTNTPPAYTTVTDGAMGIISFNRDAAPVAITESSGYTNRVDAGQSGPGDGVIVNISDLIHSSSGTQTPGVITWTGNQESCSMTFALRPAPVGGSFDQTSFRGRDDDDSETAATWKAAVNTDWDQVQDENFRVRFLVQEDDDVEDLNVEFQLQYNLNAGGWNDVNGSSSVVRSFASSEFTDGDHCTQQIGSGTFIGSQNGMDESNGLAGGANLDWSTTANQETEVEFCCQVRSADTSRGDTIELRLVKEADSVFDTYTSTPELTIPEGAGMVLASAYLSGVSAGAEDPGVFNFEKSLPWGAITIAIRKSASVAQDILDFDNVTVVGDVYNDNTGVPLQINATGGSSLTAGDPGTGAGQTDIQNTVTLEINGVATGSEPTDYVRCRIEKASDGTTLMNKEAQTSYGAEGFYKATDTYNYTGDVVVIIRARYKGFLPYESTGTVTASGIIVTAIWQIDPNYNL